MVKRGEGGEDNVEGMILISGAARGFYFRGEWIGSKWELWRDCLEAVSQGNLRIEIGI